jgi:hypothetical protein
MAHNSLEQCCADYITHLIVMQLPVFRAQPPYSSLLSAVATLPLFAGGTLKNSENLSGVGTILRIVAALAIVLLAILAVLLVLDVIPRESFKDLSFKLLSVGGITAVSLIALSFVLRK